MLDPASRLQPPGFSLQALASRLQPPTSGLQASASSLRPTVPSLQSPVSSPQTTDYRLQTPDPRPQKTPGSRLHIPDSRLQTPDSRLPPPRRSSSGAAWPSRCCGGATLTPRPRYLVVASPPRCRCVAGDSPVCCPSGTAVAPSRRCCGLAAALPLRGGRLTAALHRHHLAFALPQRHRRLAIAPLLRRRCPAAALPLRSALRAKCCSPLTLAPHPHPHPHPRPSPLVSRRAAAAAPPSPRPPSRCCRGAATPRPRAAVASQSPRLRLPSAKRCSLPPLALALTLAPRPRPHPRLAPRRRCSVALPSRAAAASPSPLPRPHAVMASRSPRLRAAAAPSCRRCTTPHGSPLLRSPPLCLRACLRAALRCSPRPVAHPRPSILDPHSAFSSRPSTLGSSPCCSLRRRSLPRRSPPRHVLSPRSSGLEPRPSTLSPRPPIFEQSCLDPWGTPVLPPAPGPDP